MLGTKAEDRPETKTGEVFAGERENTLTAKERCDRCGARAYVKTAKQDVGILLFCAHHFSEVEEAMKRQGWFTLEDQRDSLSKREKDRQNQEG